MKLLNIKQIALLSISSLLLILSPFAVAESQLVKLNVNPLSEGKFELKFEFNEAISSYTDKLNYRPNKLVIDVADASSLLELNPITIDKNGVKTVEAERMSEGLRLTINIEELMPYYVAEQGKNLVVRFGDTQQKSAATESESAIAAAIMQESGDQTAQNTLSEAAEKARKAALIERPKGYVNTIADIDFKRGSEGQGKLFVYLDNSSVAVDIKRRDQQLIVEFQSTFIPDDFLYIMDVVDFATTVNKIETFREDGTTRFVFNIKDEYNYRYDQLDTLFMIEVSKKPEDEADAPYEGKAISLNFQDIPVRTVLQLIADFNGFNLVITDSVSGNITLRLDDVPWEQALDIILKVRGLGKRMDGNVLMVAPASELAASERQQLESNNEVAALAPLYSEFIQINYAKAETIAALLSGQSASLLSERGNVTVDTRTNILLIKDTAAVIDSVKEIIEVLDVAVRQVVIEARMVTVSDSVAEDLGVSWGLDTDSASSDSRLNTLDVNLPVASSAGTLGFQIATLANGNILDLELSALEQESKAEIIASPRITTLNQQTAYIEQGTEIPYVESSSSGATTVSFEKAVLSLQVTPQITPDNKLILDLVITQDSVGETVTTSDGESVSIDTQEIQTQVLVDNGETLVLGGIYQQQISDTISKVPVLGDIPYLGYFFRNSVTDNTKSELLIFVTPRIVMQTKY
ncbi:type IV pilus secretin PilQ family protein [Psychromonas sp. 14N.309.X.WAT.B.A12]|uniref:type IV pilus secretin PilQ family protein n=1 Tax=unclassified Psychromonas TaxID=2614957 RepID=UPI0025B0CA6D|nr:type IV pilus secretin PilQ family protein [Psychromonas sp. 14N.309.X.WAT.B.A12]MDN2664033.1 type IV pilus secretin PilQ family protein [Psychromonas sp. 14N.309.X.WAT.B.A12]